MIKEGQAKLGYISEKLRLYYMAETLNNYFKTRLSAEELEKGLLGFSDYLSGRLGKIEMSRKGERFCFMVPKEGVRYVHEEVPESEFLNELISAVQKHGVTIKEIYEIFKKYSSHVHFEKMNSDEFDYLIYFIDKPGDYYYCFKEEGEHIIYHRFLPEDYEELI